MLLAFMHTSVEARSPELCLIPEKPDKFSVLARIETLRVTDAAVYRLSPEEAFTVERDEQDGGMVITPLHPARLFLTPNLPQYPGVQVKKVKILKDAEGRFRLQYQNEKDVQETWREWHPLKEKRSAGQTARL